MSKRLALAAKNQKEDHRTYIGILGEALAKAMEPDLRWWNAAKRRACDFTHPEWGKVDVKASVRSHNKWSASLKNGADAYLVFLLSGKADTVQGVYLIEANDAVSVTFTVGHRGRLRSASLGSDRIRQANEILQAIKSDLAVL
jgi:hypothetical protein